MWVCVGCSWVRRRLCVRGRGQVPLIGALDSIVGALEAHRGVASMAEAGLKCLLKLSLAEANLVRRIGCLRARAALIGRGAVEGRRVG